MATLSTFIKILFAKSYHLARRLRFSLKSMASSEPRRRQLRWLISRAPYLLIYIDKLLCIEEVGFSKLCDESLRRQNYRAKSDQPTFQVLVSDQTNQDDLIRHA